jgi:L-asparaginase II
VVFFEPMEPVVVLETRAGLLECTHHVRAVVWKGGQVAKAAGDADSYVYLRSSAKPVQALASVLTGAADRFAMTDAELALACGSHGGEPFHVETAAGLLAKIGLAEGALQCGAHAPAFEPAARALWASGAEPTQLHNNCSGKHSAMLACCVASGWETKTYLDPEHPLQVLNRANVAAFAGLSPADVKLGTDGCSAPVFAVPLAACARVFAGIANRNEAKGVSEPQRVASRRVCAALRERPEMIGGTKRVDSDVIRVTGGRVICKVGAEGLWCAGVQGADLGVAVKCEDGSAPPAYWTGLSLLRGLGVLGDAEWAEISSHLHLVRRNHRKIEVGEVEVRPPNGLY